MATRTIRVLLGFDDVPLTDEFKHILHFTFSKIGGVPDYPTNFKLDPPICPLCQLPRPLVIQLYVPLRGSVYHRTFYVFACINPNCWGSSESWLCIRVQTPKKLEDPPKKVTSVSKNSPTDWCSGADDWDDNMANVEEENGNVVSNLEKVSDEDDESCSLEDSLQSCFESMTVDDRNANEGAQGGAVGRIYSPAATAEIEGNEGEAIIIDTPTYPQHDIPALLQEVTPLPPDICLSDHRRASLIQFTSYSLIMNFEVEDNNYCYATSVEHVKELLLEYRENEETVEQTSPDGEGAVGHDFEMYEEGNPAHGDKMGHNFVSKIQANGWPILRYSREFPPLLTRPLTSQPKECQYCRGEVVFEFQILPTIISKLTLITDPIHSARLDFGTVLVYTCVKSCCSPDTTYRIEPLILQKEIS